MIPQALLESIYSSHENIRWLEPNTIFLTIHGSRAYGTNLPDSDYDVKGVAIAPLKYYLGFHQNFEQAESKNPDSVIYDIRKFFKLAAGCNPNIIEMLYTDSSLHLVSTVFGDMILQNRDMFLSQKIKHTMSGYAFEQLRKMKGLDTPRNSKHAYHMIRLLRMCREVLTEGKVYVTRPDAEELLAIRNGAWTYDHLYTWALEQDSQLGILAKNSCLPYQPDRKLLSELCEEIILKFSHCWEGWG